METIGNANHERMALWPHTGGGRNKLRTTRERYPWCARQCRDGVEDVKELFTRKRCKREDADGASHLQHFPPPTTPKGDPRYISTHQNPLNCGSRALVKHDSTLLIVLSCRIVPRKIPQVRLGKESGKLHETLNTRPQEKSTPLPCAS